MKTGLDRICPPLLPVAVLLCCGVWMGIFPLFSPAWYCLALALAAGLVFTFISFRSSVTLILCAVLAPVWGAMSMGRIHRPVLQDNHISKFADNGPKVVSGTVVSLPRYYPGKIRMVLDCSEILEKNGAPQAVSGRILLNIYGAASETSRGIPGFGDHVRFYSRLNGIRNFSNPGGYDYKARMRYLGIFGSAHAQAGKIKILPRGDTGIKTEFYRRAASMRNRFRQRVLALAKERRSDAAGVLTALVTGQKEVLPRQVKEGFARAGISHLLAISGFHLSLVALGFYLFINGALSRIHTLSVRGLARKASGVLTLIPLSGYALFTGFSPSTQRALVMVAAFMAALLAEREKDPLNILSLAALLILAFDPPALFSISFQLSFTAVFFIIVGFTRVRRMGWMPEHKGVAWLWGMVLVTLFAGLGTGPLIARYFNMVSCVQVVSNLVFVPVIGFVCLPLGLAGLVLEWIWTPGGMWVLDRGLDLLGISLRLIDCITGFEASWARVVTPDNLALALIYLFMAAVYLAVFTRKKKAYIFLAVIMTAGVLYTAYGLKQRFCPGRMSVTVLDVGQGNAAVVRTAGGSTLLIDGGGFSGSSGFDTGRFIIGPYLWRQWICNLDGVVLTHPQADHMNGLVFIMENFRVKQWFRNGDESTARAFEALTALAKEKGIPQHSPGTKGLDLAFDQTRLQILPAPGSPLDVNNNSLVCRLVHGDVSILFPGDIESDREKLLAGEGNMMASTTILVAPHHGSKSSSTNIFLDKLNAQGVIISCGYNNRYGFPHAPVLHRYRERGMKIFRTDLQGAVTMTVFRNGYDIQTQRNN
ncbi:MAG: DNA internalization-related competence protein ComEC/Rec2 [Desulfobacter sp.]|nr:MAG: DNA internalization-related competence protein ComEC/Rec2 [Desulfobacter sp.]